MKNIAKFFTLLLLLATSAGYAQTSLRDTLQTILSNDSIAPKVRLNNAHRLVYALNPFEEETERVVQDVVSSFIQKTWENKSEQQSRLASLNYLMGISYREHGGDNREEKERLFFEKMLEVALNSENDTTIAQSYRVCGYREMKRGDIKQGHEYLYRAIAFYTKIGQYVMSSEILYAMANDFFATRDTDGLKRILSQMEECLEKDTSKQSQYQYNVIRLLYYEKLLENNKKDHIAPELHLVDSMMIYTRKNIRLVENHLGELATNWIHGYAYYYLARAFDEHYPEKNDSILICLDKAVELMEYGNRIRKYEANSIMEFKTYLAPIRINALVRQGKMTEAYHAAEDALKLLNLLLHYKNLDESRYKIYQFMADYYENNNRIAEALKYQKLIRESEAKRYESEKVQAITDMSVKYETEKKEIRIHTLIREKIAARNIAWLIAGLSFVLLIASVLAVVSDRLKRKNVEQQLYETALLAELRQNELEQTHNLKQHVEVVVGKITQLIADAVIERETKKGYLDRLANIDKQWLRSAYQTSNGKLSNMDMKYLICFLAEIDENDISLIFNVNPASIYTVRYRIKKRFAKDDAFRMVL
jgi:hypothetical protein